MCSHMSLLDPESRLEQSVESRRQAFFFFCDVRSAWGKIRRKSAPEFFLGSDFFNSDTWRRRQKLEDGV